jgi:hypothetical protein
MAQTTDIDSSKFASSRRQLNAAIAHLHSRDWECAITLAAAAEGQLPEPETQTHLFRVLKKREAKDDVDFELNRVIHWLKHPTPDEPDPIKISEFEVALTISRAIQKFVAVYKLSAREFEGFSTWAVERGHLARHLTEKAS